MTRFGVDLDVYQFELTRSAHHVTQTGLKRPATTYKLKWSKPTGYLPEFSCSKHLE